MLMLGEFLKKKFHPICFAISLVAVILPFADHAYGYTQPYPAYNCGIIQTKALGFLIYNISNLLPMWVLALYYIYVFLDAYWIFKKIGRKMPKNNLKLVNNAINKFKDVPTNGDYCNMDLAHIRSI